MSTHVASADAASSSGLTRTGTILGTPLYLPPELWDGSAATSRSDVYALGLVLYELCTGEHPLAGALGIELVRRAQSEIIPPVRARRADIPELFAETIDRCLRRVPEERFRDGDELAAALASADSIFRSLGLVGRRTALDSDADVALVAASFARVAPRSDVVVAAFYERLFDLAPDVRPLFPSEMAEQRLKFASTLQLVIENLRLPERLDPLLRDLGRKHAAYGVDPAHFDVVGRALLHALASHDASGWDEPTAAAWEGAYQRIADLMRRGLADARGAA
jgi:hemoglobin-like flavoprotein